MRNVAADMIYLNVVKKHWRMSLILFLSNKLIFFYFWGSMRSGKDEQRLDLPPGGAGLQTR